MEGTSKVCSTYRLLLETEMAFTQMQELHKIKNSLGCNLIGYRCRVYRVELELEIRCFRLFCASIAMRSNLPLSQALYTHQWFRRCVGQLHHKTIRSTEEITRSANIICLRRTVNFTVFFVCVFVFEPTRVRSCLV